MTLDFASELASCLNDPRRGQVLHRSIQLGNEPPEDEHGASIAHFAEKVLGIPLDPKTLRGLDRDTAAFIARDLFTGSFVGPTRNAPSVASQITSQFFEGLRQNARFYSTYTYAVDPLGGTYSATGRHFLDNSWEAGFFFVDQNTIGVLWKGDED